MTAAADPQDPIEALLVQCLEKAPDDQQAALDALCAREPRHADALRRRHAFLLEAGLLQAAASLEPIPARIGGFRILRLLGRGGMGVVYLAEQESLSRRVALKRIRPELLDAPRARERFRREALAASRLDHPGICPVYEVGEAEGAPFLVIRYVPGRSLAEELDELRRTGAKPDPKLMVARLEKVAGALAAAHAAGLVHRDLKPGNIQIGEDGEPVLLDFGLSLLLEGDQPAMTAAGEVLGTPAYLAPEQIDGRHAIGPATDVYALGVVLYECLTLRTPFAGQTRESLYRQILQGQPERAQRRNRAVSADLQVVLDVAMERDPARRYASAKELAEDLARVLRAEPIAARRIPSWLRARRWCQRNPFAASALAALGAGLVVAVLLLAEVQRGRGEIQAQRDEIQAQRDEIQAQRDEFEAQNAARRFWDLKDRDPREAVRAALVAQRRSGPEAEAALRAARTLAWPLDGFQPEATLSIGCDVDPKGELAAWVDQNGEGWLWPIGSGAAGARRFPVQGQFSSQLRFSPDRSLFAVAGNRSDGPAARIFDRDGKHVAEMTQHLGDGVSVAWHPTRPLLAVGCRTLKTDGSERNRILLWGVDRDVLEREIVQEYWPWHVTFDPEGRLVSATGARHLEAPYGADRVSGFRVEVRSVDGQLTDGHSLHTKPVFRLTIQDGWALTGGHDRKAVIWNYAANATPVQLEDRHEGAVCGIAFAGDGLVVTACRDGSLRWFDRAGRFLRQIQLDAIPDNVLPVPDTGEVLVPCLDGVTRLLTPNGVLLRRFHMQAFGYPGDFVRLLPGRRVLVANGRGPVGVWSLDAAHRQRVEAADRVLPEPDGRALALTLRQTREIQVLRRGRETLRYQLDASVGGLEFSPDARWLAVGIVDGQVLVCDLERGDWRPVRTQRSIDQVRFSGDGRLFTTTGPHGWINLYQLDPQGVWTWAAPSIPDTSDSVSFCVPLLKTGADVHLLIRTKNGTSLWKRSGGKAEEKQMLVPWVEGPVRHADCSRNGQRFALACTDAERTVRLYTWDGTRAEPSGVRLLHERIPTWCQFDAAGERLVTIDSDRFAWVWSWDGGLLACIRSPENRTFSSARFSADGHEIITVDDQQSIERWALDLSGMKQELAARWKLGAELGR